MRKLRHKLTGTCRFIFRLLALPAKVDKGHGGVVIQAYRGYGSRQRVVLLGSVFKQARLGQNVREGTLRRDLLDILRGFLRRGIPDARIAARFAGEVQHVKTTRDGYFQIDMPLPASLPADTVWHHIDIELLQPQKAHAKTQGEVFVAPHSARYGVISDIDDTVIFTGVANKIKMLWRLFIEGPESRIAFPGVAALYRAFYRGQSGDDRNPLLYVSRGPWGIYAVLNEFFHIHRIPVGPILFLREWGMTLRDPLPHRSKGHKLALIRDMLAVYEDLPFVLIGDSGQRDPEIYTQIAREYPGRILAIYIRNVSHRPERYQAIETLAQQVAQTGSTLLLAADSQAMAKHAVEHGLIRPDTLATVLDERETQLDKPEQQPRRTLAKETPDETRNAVDQGALKEKLKEGTGEDTPPNVQVEPENNAKKHSDDQKKTDKQ